jgi:CubicO group peptidase (beta-lactamase class C family)
MREKFGWIIVANTMIDNHATEPVAESKNYSFPDLPACNTAFVPSSQSLPARHRLPGILEIPETPIHVSLDASFGVSGDSRYLGKRIDLFPKCTLEFINSGDDLIPVHRDIQRQPGGDSYWDLILSPGCTWAEPEDYGWSRAAFPFVLSHSMENDAHNGLGLFFFNHSEVSELWFQISQQTAPYLLPKQFDVWGRLKPRLQPGTAMDRKKIEAEFKVEAGGYMPLQPLASIATQAMCEDCDFDPGHDTAITYGLITQDEIYSSPPVTRQGTYPFEQQMRHGSWSMAKSAAATLSLLRLAQLYGDQVLDSRVADYVDVSGSHQGWQDVTLADCLNMATGIGDGQQTAEPVDIKADNRHDPKVSPEGAALYRQWYEQPSAEAKLNACLNYGNYPWGPGKVARYRDPDLFMAGVVMDAVYKSRAGPAADLWQMITKDVYSAIDIHHLPMNRTIEKNGTQGLPIMAVGLFPRLDDLAKIANLFHRKGRFGTEQLLSSVLLSAATDHRVAKGLPTGDHSEHGAITYHLAFWHYPYRSLGGQTCYIPAMRGYGGNILMLLPNGMSAFRIANDTVSKRDNPYDAMSFVRLADRIQPFRMERVDK